MDFYHAGMPKLVLHEGGGQEGRGTNEKQNVEAPRRVPPGLTGKNRIEYGLAGQTQMSKGGHAAGHAYRVVHDDTSGG